MRHRVYEKVRTCLRLLAMLLATSGAMNAACADDDAPIRLGDYELGRGLALGGTGATLGGYATARYQDPEGGTGQLSLDHLSMMLWWEGAGRFRFFTEVDLQKGVATRRDTPDDDSFLSLERIYVDYVATDSVTLRAGKYLTPIGRWNQIHADPLVWTTSRPMVTDQVFPSTATGVMVLGTVPLLAIGLDYQVFVEAGSDRRPTPNEDPFSEARGLHLNAPLTPELQIGLSLASFEQEDMPNDHKQLVGLDFLWTQRRWELSGEGVYRSSSLGADNAEYGGYVQLVAPLTERLYAVTRAELFRFAGDSSARAWVAGLNYRYRGTLTLKAEWVEGHDLPPGLQEGFLASASILF